MLPPASRRPTVAGTAIASGRRPRVDPSELASRLAPAVRWSGELDNETRSWRLMARTADFDAWLIAWPRGGKVELHDHGTSTGAVSVISGVLVEAVPWRDDTDQLSLVRHELHAGATLGFGAGHVHDVTNESDEHTLSLHVYSPALTSMTFYELSGDQLEVRDVTWSADGSGQFEHAMGEVAAGVSAAAIH